MTIQDLGSLGELLAAMATIATLIYLAAQIRQNTSTMAQAERTARGQSYQEIVSKIVENMSASGIDESAADISYRGIKNFGSLSDLEKHRFNIQMSGYVIMLENGYYQHLDGMLSEERWEVLLRQLGVSFAAPGVRQWWNAYYPREILHKDFAAVLDEMASREEASMPTG
jgi:hypothetical protein